jgi:hypothetical protein
MEQEKDIVERLRSHEMDDPRIARSTIEAAADEIERLRGALLKWSCPQCRMLGKGWGTTGGLGGIRKQEQAT